MCGRCGVLVEAPAEAGALAKGARTGNLITLVRRPSAEETLLLCTPCWKALCAAAKDWHWDE